MSAARDAAAAARELGAQAYLTKPFDMDAVLDVVERLIREIERSQGGEAVTSG
jgi:DNA-binding response OmpR family regulator